MKCPVLYARYSSELQTQNFAHALAAAEAAPDAWQL